MKVDTGGVSVEMGGDLVEQGSGRVVHVNKVGSVKRVIAKKRKPYRRVKKTVPNVPKALQELFVSCREIFKGPGTVPSSQDVQQLCHILGMIISLDLFICVYTRCSWIRKMFYLIR